MSHRGPTADYPAAAVSASVTTMNSECSRNYSILAHLPGWRGRPDSSQNVAYAAILFRCKGCLTLTASIEMRRDHSVFESPSPMMVFDRVPHGHAIRLDLSEVKEAA